MHAKWNIPMSLQWRHNKRDGMLNHRRLDCLLNRLFRRRSKKTPKHRVTGLCDRWIPRTNDQQRGFFSFDDVIMFYLCSCHGKCNIMIIGPAITRLWCNSFKTYRVYLVHGNIQMGDRLLEESINRIYDWAHYECPVQYSMHFQKACNNSHEMTGSASISGWPWS